MKFSVITEKILKPISKKREWKKSKHEPKFSERKPSAYTTSRREKNETSQKKKASFFKKNTKKRHFRDHCEEPT